MKTYTEQEERRIASGVRLIKLWRKNIRFIEKRLEMQREAAREGRMLHGRKYYPFCIEQERIKIKKAKLTLENI